MILTAQDLLDHLLDLRDRKYNLSTIYLIVNPRPENEKKILSGAEASLVQIGKKTHLAIWQIIKDR